MTGQGELVHIVVAEDDPDDQFLIKEAFAEAHLVNKVDFVEDGQELIDYLNRHGKFADIEGPFLPGLVLLDLNLPRMDGREALKIIRADPKLHRIPVIVLTTSQAEEDVLRTYDLGANSFITKPVTFEDLAHIIKSLSEYWLQIVRLPPS